MTIHNNLEGARYPQDSITTNRLSGEKVPPSSKTSHLLSSLPFPADASTSQQEALFSTKRAIFDESPLQELEQILKTSSQQIEKQLNALENTENNKKFIEHVLKGEDFFYELLSSKNENFRSALGFLNNVLPQKFIDQIPHYDKIEKLGGISALGSVLLNAVDCGFQGLALIYKSEILHQCKTLLVEFKTSIESEMERQGVPLSQTKLDKLQQKLKEWETKVEHEEKSLAREKQAFRPKLYSTTLSLVETPLEYLPKGIWQLLHKAASAFPITSGIETVILGIKLITTHKESRDLSQWCEGYKIWLDKHQAKSWILEANNRIVQTSENLLDKRQAIVREKVKQLLPLFHTVEPQIKELKKSAFVRDMERLGNVDPQTIEDQFQNWFDTQTRTDEGKESLLEFYIDHQETIEHTTKNALKQMIEKKHEVQSRLLNFKLTKSSISFSVASIALAVSVTLTVLGMLSIPFGGAGLLLLILSVGSTVISLGFLGASHFIIGHYKSFQCAVMTTLFQAKMAWTKIRLAIHIYTQQSKEKKLLAIAKILHELRLSSASVEKKNEEQHQKALIDYKKAKLEFEKSQENVKHWSERLHQFEACIAKATWQDFARHASLQIADDTKAFDTLQAFQEALQACDLRLLSAETKTLLELQLGVDLEALQEQIDKNPAEIKNTLQQFFLLEDSNFVDFIRKQNIRLAKGLIS
jgi:hypothetical protein